MTTTWHAPPDTLARFARHPESLDEVTASSVEQHLIGCDECRAAVAGAADRVALQRSWDEVVDIIDRPAHSLTQRMLERFGMPGDLARVIGATPGLRLAWLVTVAVLAIGAVQVARQHDTESFFLVVAPLLPLGSVLVTFLPTEEPGGEAAAATPMYGAALVLRRSVATLAPTFALLAAAGVALPHLNEGARWLLPALALSTTAMALATCIRAVVAVAALASTWIILVTAVRMVDGRRVPLVETAVFEPSGQILALAAALLAVAVLYARRDRFSTVEVTW